MTTKTAKPPLAIFVLATAMTSSALQFGDFTYEINNPDTNTVTITGYTGAGGTVDIPETINTLPVTAIGESAFWDEAGVSSVNVPDSVTSISNYAFSGCTGLTNAILGSGVTGIGYGAFSICTKLRGIIIPDCVTYIGDDAFLYCTNLTTATLGVGVLQIGDYALADCPNLTRIIIPDNVNVIGHAAFWRCYGLTTVTIGKSVTNIWSHALNSCTNLTGVYFRGSAPSAGSDVFFNADQAIVYYLHGTTGWGATFADRPTQLWNPVIQTDDGNFGVQGGTFGFNITESESGLLVIEACPDLASDSWVPVQTNSMSSNLVYFSDADWLYYTNQFYRLSMP